MFLRKKAYFLFSSGFIFLAGYLIGLHFSTGDSSDKLSTSSTYEGSSSQLFLASKTGGIQLNDSEDLFAPRIDPLCSKRSFRERLKELKSLTPDLAIAPTISVSIQGFDLKFVGFNSWTIQRANTIRSKEPGTLKWIGSFKPHETVWDIGANVGMYTIYIAKLVKGVYAFEPNNGNAFTLLANIRANNLCNVNLFAIGLGEKNGFFPFEYSSLHFGVSHNQIQGSTNDTSTPPKKKKRYRETEMKTVRTIDSMVQQKHIPLPDHIKLDVDGLEISILRGMRESLRSGSVKTLLVEAEGYDQALEIYKFMSNIGAKLQQIEILRSSGKDTLYDVSGIPKNAICNMLWRFK